MVLHNYSSPTYSSWSSTSSDATVTKDLETIKGFLNTASGVGNAVVGACNAGAVAATSKNSASAVAAQASAKVRWGNSSRTGAALNHVLWTGGPHRSSSERKADNLTSIYDTHYPSSIRLQLPRNPRPPRYDFPIKG